MKTLFYSTQNFELEYLTKEEKKQNQENNTFDYIPYALKLDSAILAEGYDAISINTGDDASEKVLEILAWLNIKKIAIRAAGYDNVDLKKAKELGFQVANVPDYSPSAIAEFAITLMLNLARKIKTTEKQVKEYDFRTENLIGFELNQKTIGIIGTGHIGAKVAKILYAFGAKILAFDLNQNEELKKELEIEYRPLQYLIKESDIISIHTGLNPNTRHMIGEDQIKLMKPGVMLINTGRGACIETKAVLDALKEKKIGYFGADVYEFEKGIFFHDFQKVPMKDPWLKELIEMENVIITPHQAFATHEALTNIAKGTFESLGDWNLKNSLQRQIC